MKHKFLFNNLVVFALMNCQGALNWLFQVVLGKGTTPVEYGTFNALFSLFGFACSFSTIIQMVVAKFTALHNETDLLLVRGLLRKTVKTVIAISLLLFVVIFLAMNQILFFLHIESSIQIYMIFLMFVLMMISAVLLGILQGSGSYLSFGVSGTIYPGVKLLLLFPLVFWLSMSVNGALISCIIGLLAMFIVQFIILKKQLFGEWRKPEFIELKSIIKSAAPLAMLVISTSAIGMLDIVLVKHYCSEHSAGLYASASVMGKIPFLLGGIFVTVLFPEAVKSVQRGESSIKLLLSSLGLTAFFSGGCAFACVFFASQMLSFLYGEEYLQAVPLLQICAISMCAFSLNNIVLNFCVAKNQLKVLYFFIICVFCTVGSISIWHDSPKSIALQVMSGVIISFIVSFLFIGIVYLRSLKINNNQ